ncbi:MAG TPA: DUF6157 family protein [Saprospiraceae bacterium]|nr:DUF6157 family protein [Saprospiraceae bacterium]HMP24557.1 DUF6157 family protein [Saprospiraceae bacterium]
MTNKEKIHSNNYFNTLIEVSLNSDKTQGLVPNSNNDKHAIARLQYDIIYNDAYKYTSDEVISKLHTIRNKINQKDYTETQEEFFNKGRRCLRTSPLCKNYGFGIHANKEGKITLIGVETDEYKRLAKDMTIKKIKAMKP